MGAAPVRYEEEEEFDAVKDALALKHVYLVALRDGGSTAEDVRTQLSGMHFDAGFCSQQVCSCMYVVIGKKSGHGLGMDHPEHLVTGSTTCVPRFRRSPDTPARSIWQTSTNLVSERTGCRSWRTWRMC